MQIIKGLEGIHAITNNDPLYPAKLRHVPSPPRVLYFRGDGEQFSRLDYSVAIVGTRRADKFGCELAFQFAEQCAASGVPVVSGLAEGIDTAAHRGALTKNSPLPTIAVLGNGLQSIYPKKNEFLAREILERGGLIVSQFPSEMAPRAQNFLDRNRVISGLSDATLVIQAPKRSGALSTATHALSQGRDLLVVPGGVNDPRYEGSLRLLRSGAHLISSASDLAEFFPEDKKSAKKKRESALSSEEKKIIKRLKNEVKLHIDELSAEFSDPGALAEILIQLEVSGIIASEPGNFIRLLRR